MLQLFVFVEGSEINLADDRWGPCDANTDCPPSTRSRLPWMCHWSSFLSRVDLVYSYKCPRDQDECGDISDLTWQWWLVFAILMIAHLAKDIINGTKMIIFSAKARHSSRQRAWFFIGGTLLASVTGERTCCNAFIYSGCGPAPVAHHTPPSTIHASLHPYVRWVRVSLCKTYMLCGLDLIKWLVVVLSTISNTAIATSK